MLDLISDTCVNYQVIIVIIILIVILLLVPLSGKQPLFPVIAAGVSINQAGLRRAGLLWTHCPYPRGAVKALGSI